MDTTVSPSCQELDAETQKRILVAFLRMTQKQKAKAFRAMLIVRLGPAIEPVNELSWLVHNYDTENMQLTSSRQEDLDHPIPGHLTEDSALWILYHLSLKDQADRFTALIKMRLNKCEAMGNETNELSYLIKVMIQIEKDFPWLLTA